MRNQWPMSHKDTGPSLVSPISPLPGRGVIEHPSPNFDPRPDGRRISMLVLHYTGMKTMQSALSRLCDPAAKVSAHYLIDEDGTVRQLLGEEKRAWHAGLSFWRGNTDINARSIGIELVNPGHEFGYRCFPEDQIAALEALALDILNRRLIAPYNVVGHSDVAPSRKMDPGELFPWPRLAEKKIGLWPWNWQPVDANSRKIKSWLAAFGYDCSDLEAALAAFQRHFRPRLISGRPDAETVGRLCALLKMLLPT